jgi:hypothetical protein
MAGIWFVCVLDLIVQLFEFRGVAAISNVVRSLGTSTPYYALAREVGNGTNMMSGYPTDQDFERKFD